MRMKIIAGVAAALLAAPALAQNDSQTSPRVEGTFRGGVAGYAQQLAIQRLDSDRYAVQVSVATQGCTGAMQGTGTVSGHMMVIRDAAGACTLHLYRAGPNVQIDVESCSGYTGGACDFGGTYSRR